MSKKEKPAAADPAPAVATLAPAIASEPGQDAPTAAAAATDPAPAVTTHRISGVPAHGFYRAGRHWPREGVEVARADFTKAQWAALEAEPRLTVTRL